MDLFGRGYVIEHCMSTLELQLKQEIYKNYLANALRLVVNNTAATYPSEEPRMILNKSYDELINPQKYVKQEIDAEEESKKIISKIRGLLRN